MKNEECICTLLSCKKVNEKDQNNHFKLQPLPYAENALETLYERKNGSVSLWPAFAGVY